MEKRMSEEVLAFDLKVICADKSEHERVELKLVDDRVVFVTQDGVQLKGDCAVTFIDNGNFLVPAHTMENAIVRYRKQN
jgi:hypothetical protein